MKDLLKGAIAWLISRLPSGILTDRRYFDLYQSRGVHITPVHFYEPVPDTRDFTDRDFAERSEMVGIDKRLGRQEAMLADEAFAKTHAEYLGVIARYREDPEIAITFGGLDGAVLFHLVRTLKPARIIEIGSGFSTVVSSEALSLNAAEGGPVGRLEAIEPYPRAYLTSGRLTNVVVNQSKVQAVPLEKFQSLDASDILFIDSSHVVSFKSDVVYEINEIIPRLKPGVYIHIHDIQMPYEYSKDWVMRRKIFWNEQYMVQAFLQFNDSFEIVWSAGLARASFPEKLRPFFPDFDPERQQSGSLWIRRVR